MFSAKDKELQQEVFRLLVNKSSESFLHETLTELGAHALAGRTCPSELVLEVKIQCPMFENEFHLCKNFSPEMKIDTCSTSIYTPGHQVARTLFSHHLFSLVFLCQVQPNNVETITKTLETSLGKTVTLKNHDFYFTSTCSDLVPIHTKHQTEKHKDFQQR